MDATIYKSIWDDRERIVLAPHQLKKTLLPQSAMAFLTELGLPREYYWFSHELLENGLQLLPEVDSDPVREDEYYIDPSPQETPDNLPLPKERLYRMCVLGKEKHSSRSLRWYSCVENETGQVFRVTCGGGVMGALFHNSSVEQYAAFLLTLHRFYKPGKENPMTAPDGDFDFADDERRTQYHRDQQVYRRGMMEHVLQEWEQIDPLAVQVLWNDETSIWRTIIQDISVGM